MAAAAGPKGDIGKDLLGKAEGLLVLVGRVLTRNELVNAVLAARPSTPADRDQRKTSVTKALNALIKAGHLLQSNAGLITMPVKANGK